MDGSVALVYQGGRRSRLPVVQEMLRATEKLPGLVRVALPDDLDQDQVNIILGDLYQRGIRTYIGWEGSQALEAGLPFLRSHPDVRAISIGSSSTALALKDNIWRLSLPDHIMAETMLRYARVKGYKNVVLLWDQDGSWPQSMSKDILQMSRIPVISVPFRIGPTVPILGPDGRSLTHDLLTLMRQGSIHPEKTLFILLLARDLDRFFRETGPFWKQYGFHLIAGDGAEGYEFLGLEDVAQTTRFMVVHNQTPTTSTILDLKAKGYNAPNTVASILDAYRLARISNIQDQVFDGAEGLVAFDPNGDKAYGWVALSQFIPGQGYKSRWILIRDPSLGIAFSPLNA